MAVAAPSVWRSRQLWTCRLKQGPPKVYTTFRIFFHSCTLSSDSSFWQGTEIFALFKAARLSLTKTMILIQICCWLRPQQYLLSVRAGTAVRFSKLGANQPPPTVGNTLTMDKCLIQAHFKKIPLICNQVRANQWLDAPAAALRPHCLRECHTCESSLIFILAHLKSPLVHYLAFC